MSTSVGQSFYLHRTILWFRNDLRLHDNPLFHHTGTKQGRSGASSKNELLCTYCADPAILAGHLRETGLPKVGPWRTKFFLESVLDLRHSLKNLGSDLFIASEAPEVFLPRLAMQQGDPHVGTPPSFVTVVVAQGVTPEEMHAEKEVEVALAALPIPARLERVWGLSLYHIEDLPYQDIRKEFPMVFAPFGREVRGNFRAADAKAVSAAQRGEVGVPIREELATPETLSPVPENLQSLIPDDISSIWPRAPSVAVHNRSLLDVEPWWDVTFHGGERFGLERLEKFVSEDLPRYKETRNGLIGLHYSSKLSPWIAAGCVSPRRVAAAIRNWEIKQHRGRPTPSSAHYLSEYGWRDFLIFLALKLGSDLFKLRGPGRTRLPWVRDDTLEKRLFEGRIGIPLIDAAIREMLVSGFMSNRARQFVASYIILELKLDWRVGAELFESMLIDYDVCSNWGNWMRAAGVSGMGFGHGGSRWFNLAEERDRFDRKGDYVKLWLPELKNVAVKHLHAPWMMSNMEQEASNCKLGVDYFVPPETPSKHVLEGSAVAEDVVPEWYVTTRKGKQEHPKPQQSATRHGSSTGQPQHFIKNAHSLAKGQSKGNRGGKGKTDLRESEYEHRAPKRRWGRG